MAGVSKVPKLDVAALQRLVARQMTIRLRVNQIERDMIRLSGSTVADRALRRLHKFQQELKRMSAGCGNDCPWQCCGEECLPPEECNDGGL